MERGQKQASVTYVPMLKVSHRYVVQYWHRYSTEEKDSFRHYNFIDKDGHNITYAGQMSKGSIRRLQNACELMIAITPKKSFISAKDGRKITYRIGLVTLTLSAPQQEITDRQLKNDLLAPFLRKLKKYGLKHYIWKAERQQNGNLHFHIFIDCFVPKEDISNIWNRLQSKFHFINSFQAKHGHRDPPSTNIKAVISTEGLTRYMLKYMLKPVEKGEQMELGRDYDPAHKGKVWDCSEALKSNNTTAAEVEEGDYFVINKAVDAGLLKEVQKDHATIYFYTKPESFRALPKSLRDRYNHYLNDVKRVASGTG